MRSHAIHLSFNDVDRIELECEIIEATTIKTKSGLAFRLQTLAGFSQSPIISQWAFPISMFIKSIGIDSGKKRLWIIVSCNIDPDIEMSFPQWEFLSMCVEWYRIWSAQLHRIRTFEILSTVSFSFRPGKIVKIILWSKIKAKPAKQFLFSPHSPQVRFFRIQQSPKTIHR